MFLSIIAIDYRYPKCLWTALSQNWSHTVKSKQLQQRISLINLMVQILLFL